MTVPDLPTVPIGRLPPGRGLLPLFPVRDASPSSVGHDPDTVFFPTT